MHGTHNVILIILSFDVVYYHLVTMSYVALENSVSDFTYIATTGFRFTGIQLRKSNIFSGWQFW